MRAILIVTLSASSPATAAAATPRPTMSSTPPSAASTAPTTAVPTRALSADAQTSIRRPAHATRARTPNATRAAEAAAVAALRSAAPPANPPAPAGRIAAAAPAATARPATATTATPTVTAPPATSWQDCPTGETCTNGTCRAGSSDGTSGGSGSGSGSSGSGGGSGSGGSSGGSGGGSCGWPTLGLLRRQRLLQQELPAWPGARLALRLRRQSLSISRQRLTARRDLCDFRRAWPECRFCCFSSAARRRCRRCASGARGIPLPGPASGHRAHRRHRLQGRRLRLLDCAALRLARGRPLQSGAAGARARVRARGRLLATGTGDDGDQRAPLHPAAAAAPVTAVSSRLHAAADDAPLHARPVQPEHRRRAARLRAPIYAPTPPPPVYTPPPYHAPTYTYHH